MKKYDCVYHDLARTVGIPKNSDRIIEANSKEEAYQKYLKEFGAFPHSVYVIPTGILGTGEYFHDHIEEIIIRKEEESSRQTANELLSYISSRKSDGYFKLSKTDKIKIQSYFLYLSNTVEKRELSDGEIEFIKAWIHYKDRELGQSLIAQAEAKKPAAERGKSQLAQTITMGIVAGNFAKGNQLRELKELNESVDEIAEDVEDVSGGFEG